MPWSQSPFREAGPGTPVDRETSGGSRGETLQSHLLVASDGSAAAETALEVAAALSARDQARVDIVTVAPMRDDVDFELEDDLLAEQRELIGKKGVAMMSALDRCKVPAAATWPVMVRAGSVGREIARAADELGCTLIVLGLSEHDAFERAFARETALRVMRFARVPIFAASAAELPRRAMVAVDLSEKSLHTARAALAVLGASGTLFLAHVAPRIPVPFAGTRTWDPPAPDELHRPFDRLLANLVAPPTVRIVPVHLFGDPAVELLRFAAQSSVDLIVAGASRRLPIAKKALRGVSTRLFQSARCSILMVPPPQ